MRDLDQGKNRKPETLYDMLATYSESDFYPYHMPGHKRNNKINEISNFFSIDITEIDGFDNLHQAEGVIQQAQKRAADLYGADESFFLINGSTCGILAAVLAVTDKSDTVLIARNCHKSVYHAALLQELNLKYIYPEQIDEYDINDAVSPEVLEKALDEYPECKAVIITSPTYEGVISDIGRIAEAVHNRGSILIVDEAHGAHLGLSKALPENAVRQGADLVIHSLHKTLPAMTQSALLHVKGSYVNRNKLKQYLRIFQSSSPSYVLMAGIDVCIAYIKENSLRDFEKQVKYYRKFINETKKCKHIHVAVPELLNSKKYSFTAWDMCKLVISVKNSSISGQELYNILRDRFHLQMEMAANSYVLAIMTIADEWEAWKRLADALLQIDVRIEGGDALPQHVDNAAPKHSHRPSVKMNIAQALAYVHTDPHEILLEQALGKVSGGFINLYPPGIPIIVPGEIIDEEIIRQIRCSLELGLNVQGISDTGTVLVLKNYYSNNH